MGNSGEAEDSLESELWSQVEGDMRAIFGDAVEFEIEEYGDYIEVHLQPGDAVEQLEAAHDDLQFVPFNSGKMTVRRDR